MDKFAVSSPAAKPWKVYSMALSFLRPGLFFYLKSDIIKIEK